MTTTNTELLAPAGSPEALDAAIAEGADAVYLGLRDFIAGSRGADFTYPQFEGALRVLHRMGRKIYVTVDTVFEQREADRVYQLLKYLADLEPDGILAGDFGIIAMAREHFPMLKLHASAQMNIASARGTNLLSRHGFSGVALARELSLDEIRDIRSNTNMGLAVFVHGTLCISVSGLCLFSSYLGGKSANRGMCTQACRRFYTAHKGKSLDESAGENGGYYFSPADLELIEEVPDLAKAGVNSFIIEGLKKSAEYVGTVVSAYRLVMDNLDAEEDALRRAISDARKILKNDFARPKTTYLLNGAGYAEVDWLNPLQNGGMGIPLGKLIKVKPDNMGLLPQGTISLSAGDSIRLHKIDDSARVSHKIREVKDGPDGSCWVSIPEGYGPGDEVFLIQTKAMSKRYAQIVPQRLADFKRRPGRDKAPESNTEKKPMQRGGSKRGNREDFPPGIYAMVSRIEDLYVLQSVRPVKVIISWNIITVKHLTGNNDKGLPFKAQEIIISLDPFFPQEKEKELAAGIPTLIEKGYTQFIVNNLGHFSLFRQNAENEKRLILIAGPWLYTFNTWAWDFLSRCGAEYCITPYENNRQNLERSFQDKKGFPGQRPRVFITVFSRPGLFRIRQDLTAVYQFENITGNKGEAFHLLYGPDGTLVFPWDTFSITDKMPFLRKAGFNRFILDFSSGPLKKAEYRDIMDAVNRSVPLPGASRFNWKNGFYRKDTLDEK